MLKTTGEWVEIVIDNGLDFTLGDFPQGFAAKDLAREIAPQVRGLTSIRITTPRVKSAHNLTPYTYDYVFRGETNRQRWGYTHRVSETVIRSWVGGPVVVGEMKPPSTRLDIERVASAIAREINEGVLKLLAQSTI